MHAQSDMFAAGEVRSVPPQFDPAKVGAIHTRAAVDRDHVGSEEVGKFGNNADVVVVEVWDKDGAIMWAEQCPTARSAVTLANSITKRLEQNRQADLFG